MDGAVRTGSRLCRVGSVSLLPAGSVSLGLPQQVAEVGTAQSD